MRSLTRFRLWSQLAAKVMKIMMMINVELTSVLFATWPFLRESRKRFGVGSSVFSPLSLPLMREVCVGI